MIYAVGAITHATALAKAGLGAKAVFTVIPLEQHLDKGIEVLVRPLSLVFIAFLLVALATVESVTRISPPHSILAALRRVANSQRSRATILLLLSMGAVAIVYFRPVLAGAFVISMGVMFGSLGAFSLTGHSPLTPGTARISLALGIVALVLYGAYITPETVPRVSLSLDSGRPITGGLITFSDGNWYVITSHQDVEAIDARRVVSVQITPGRPYRLVEYKTLPQLLN